MVQIALPSLASKQFHGRKNQLTLTKNGETPSLARNPTLGQTPRGNLGPLGQTLHPSHRTARPRQRAQVGGTHLSWCSRRRRLVTVGDFFSHDRKHKRTRCETLLWVSRCSVFRLFVEDASMSNVFASFLLQPSALSASCEVFQHLCWDMSFSTGPVPSDSEERRAASQPAPANPQVIGRSLFWLGFGDIVEPKAKAY